MLRCAPMIDDVDYRTAAGAIDAEIAVAVAEAMRALAAPSRVLILGCLREGARSVGALAEAVDMEVPPLLREESA